jgi:hypothetical protein
LGSRLESKSAKVKGNEANEARPISEARGTNEMGG